MSFDIKDQDNGPQPFIRQEPKRRTVEHDEDEPDSRPAGGGGLGCALVGLVIVAVAILIGAALFLPPFSVGDRFFGTPFAPLNAQSASTTFNGLTVAVDPANAGSGFGVRLKLIKPEVFNGTSAASAEDAAWLKMARASLPQTLTLLSPVYQIEKQGTTPGMTLAFAPPQGADLAQVDVFRYDSQINRWLFVPAHASTDGKAIVANVTVVPDRIALFLPNRLVPIISVAVDVGQQLTPEVAGVANIVHPAGLQPAPSGALQGVLPAGVEPGKGYGVVPVIRNFSNPAAIDVATVTTLLQNSGLRTVHVERLVEFASSKPYQGLAIDYRRLPADQRESFTAFIVALAQKMHNASLSLTVVVPFPAQKGADFDTGAYDWRAIGTAADSLQIIAPLDPQVFADKGLADSVLKWAVGEVNRARLQVALTTLSVQETSGSFTPITYVDALAPLGQVTVKSPSTVPADTPIEASLSGYRAVFAPLDSSHTPSIQYFGQDGTLVGTMWLTNGPVFYERLNRIGAYNLGGVMVPDLSALGIPVDAVQMLTAYKLNQPINGTPAALALHWTVQAGNKVVMEATAVPGTPFIYKASAGTDSIVINANIVGATATLGPVVIRISTAVPPPAPTITPIPATVPPPAPTQAATAAAPG